jgi:hypothetical protein
MVPKSNKRGVQMKQFKEIARRPGTKLLKWERAQRYLLANGWESLQSKSKYMAFMKDGYVPLFVGKAGAIRMGLSASNSQDRAFTYWKLIEEWEIQTGKGSVA